MLWSIVRYLDDKLLDSLITTSDWLALISVQNPVVNLLQKLVNTSWAELLITAILYFDMLWPIMISLDE